MKKRNLAIAFVILIAFISLATFNSCNNGGGEMCSCTPPRDSNNDCICDICGLGTKFDSEIVPCGTSSPN